ncbi:MAG: hypothetical protein A2033_01765 [Bacteroidetes bacterium GWA2_31_9]|nr:MAG: hypothetical protein A2033_01765 [Bacteroidetes bacterium GWA2_31_9]
MLKLLKISKFINQNFLVISYKNFYIYKFYLGIKGYKFIYLTNLAMLRKITFTVISLLFSYCIYAQSSGSLQGSVVDPESGEAVPFANVTIESDGSVITGGMTDFDGKYVIKPIPAGKYNVKASSVGYNASQINGVLIKGGKITFQDFKIAPATQILQEVEIKDYTNPLIDKDNTKTGGTVTAEDIAKMPGRSAASVATTVGGVYSENGTDINIRGARSEGTVYYVDGIKIMGTQALPKSAIAEVSVITGGLPASYGDATGGIISVITKGPSQTFYGGLEVATSKLLDPYNENILGFNVSGPLLFHKDKMDSTKRIPIVGFLLAGELNYTKDGDPSSIGIWKANEETQDYITNDPLRRVSGQDGTYLNAEFLDSTNFKNIKAKENAVSKEMSLSAKIDISPSRNFNITIGGSINYTNQHLFSLSNSLFNSQNNPQQIYSNWRTYIRLTQKFTSYNPDKEEAKSSIIKNAYYSIQADYSKVNSVTQDDTHKDNFFNYGYVGKFDVLRQMSYSSTDTLPGFGNGVMQHDGYMDTLVVFTPGELNPEMATVTDNYFHLFSDPNKYMNFLNVENGGALLNGQQPRKIYDYWRNPGTQYNQYVKSQRDQFRLSASGSADVKNHEISLGFEFEQRVERYYRLYDFLNGPGAVWTLARQYMNNHIIELDKSNLHMVYDSKGVFQDTVWYDRLYNDTNQYEFDINFRDHIGMPINSTQWVDIDSYDPSDLSVDFFSPEELLNVGNTDLTYYGYDYTGKKLKKNPSFEEFFTETYSDLNGNVRKKREIAPYQPNYMSGYIQDKFAFKDLIFNIGIRVDRFDANQPVLKDQYLLYEAFTAGDIRQGKGSKISASKIPSSMGDNYIIYVDDIKAPSKINGFRDGTTWYDADGAPINDPTLIASSTGIAPYLVNPDVKMSDDTYEPGSSFKDYDPKYTIMPRISFSFPISDVALFFAHYDVLSIRPSYGANLNPLDYFYINQNASNVLNNPDAKPEKTIDYELGFQQKVSNSSSLKLSAFYKEMRDMQQVVRLVGAYPISYMTYGNIDFGTVKGLTVAYDLRRTGNISLRVSYTLQFANGTGSDAQSGLNLMRSNQPNLRTTLPLDYDQRHSIVITTDYRFASGRAYNGPKWFGKDILQNTGANFVINTGSGTPYSKQLNVTNTVINSDLGNGTLDGSVNGSRKPWKATIDTRIDRDFVLKFGKGDDKKKEVPLNIYFEIQNILNAKNIISVYRATGNPDDNGYLSANEFQDGISTQTNEDAYRNYYSMAVNSPYNYSLPRRMRIGLQLSF